MRPILLQIGGHVVFSHTVFSALGVMVALIAVWRIARRERRADQDLLVIVAGGLVGAAIMSRYGLVLRYLWETNDPSFRGFLAYGGKSLLAGLAGAYLGVIITKKLIGYSRPTGDLLVPGTALGMAIGRIGCFLAERPGTVTTLPWGVRVPADAVPRIARCPACVAGATMHPSFLYEAAFLGIASLLLFRIVRRPTLAPRWLAEGDIFKSFLLVYAVFRFFIEFVRGNTEMVLGLSGSQLTVLPGIVALVVYFVRRRQHYRPASVDAVLA